MHGISISFLANLGSLITMVPLEISNWLYFSKYENFNFSTKLAKKIVKMKSFRKNPISSFISRLISKKKVSDERTSWYLKEFEAQFSNFNLVFLKFDFEFEKWWLWIFFFFIHQKPISSFISQPISTNKVSNERRSRYLNSVEPDFWISIPFFGNWTLKFFENYLI